jgi:hypothetical protein
VLPLATEIIGDAVQERFNAQPITTFSDKIGKLVDQLD